MFGEYVCWKHKKSMLLFEHINTQEGFLRTPTFPLRQIPDRQTGLGIESVPD